MKKKQGDCRRKRRFEAKRQYWYAAYRAWRFARRYGNNQEDVQVLCRRLAC